MDDGPRDHQEPPEQAARFEDRLQAHLGISAASTRGGDANEGSPAHQFELRVQQNL